MKILTSIPRYSAYTIQVIYHTMHCLQIQYINNLLFSSFQTSSKQNYSSNNSIPLSLYHWEVSITITFPPPRPPSMHIAHSLYIPTNGGGIKISPQPSPFKKNASLVYCICILKFQHKWEPDKELVVFFYSIQRETLLSFPSPCTTSHLSFIYM